jgi:hypothetical protein
MDPNETLRRIRILVQEGDDCFALEDMQELFGALDDWLSRGGFLPKDWESERDSEEVAMLNAKVSELTEQLLSYTQTVDRMKLDLIMAGALHKPVKE